MKINNCPTCGGKVEFSPQDKALKCEKCSNIFNIETKTIGEKHPLNQNNQNIDKGYQLWKDSKRTFQCKNCGAQIILNKYEMSKKCSYCNTSSLTPTDNLPGLKPDGIIPFRISKDIAHTHFKTIVKKRKFLPNKFKKNLPNIQIGATYFSSFSFEIDTFATYTAVKVVSRTVKTKNGYTTVNDYIPVSGSIKHIFPDVVVETSDKITQDQINGILPYYFRDCYSYDDDFVQGYSVGYYNQNLLEANNIAREQTIRLLEDMINDNDGGNLQDIKINAEFSNEKYNYVLLPLYFINYKYKDKEYLNLMNGQTGKTSGKLPRSAVKVTFFSLFIMLLVIGFPLLLILLT